MEKDRTLKALLSNKAVFASLINTFIFRQNHFIAPEQILFLAIQGKLQFDHNLHYFDRDVFALVTDSNGKPWFMAGFKNQSAIDPNMDIRNLIYDATAWDWQLTKIRETRRKKRKAQKQNIPLQAVTEDLEKRIRIVTKPSKAHGFNRINIRIYKLQLIKRYEIVELSYVSLFCDISYILYIYYFDL
ncbi:hypothetical protein [uncultured Dubosiella sp.]|uniref:hypothetical protein n=1 Tax=uncultured Dubosiella sp. TaxID=1937011 RepID=UPI00263386A2|nr:hypothetical protein [uncultured Dubosiella sp.]